MIGILIVTHGHLSESLLDAASMFVSDTRHTGTVTFLSGQGVEDIEASVRGAIQELTPNDGILALVDLPGGSPARAIGGLLFENEKIELLTGVNLPMLVEVLMLRGDLTLTELADHAFESGTGGIANIGKILRSQGGVA
ncbi:MAG: PTS sugar transporter subunit IIA [Desulfitobacteriaceae bacterium]